MSITVTEFPLNRRESFKAVISERSGLQVVSLGRWKIDANGVSRPAGPTFEFAAHRLNGIAELICDVQRLVGDHVSKVHVQTADPERASA